MAKTPMPWSQSSLLGPGVVQDSAVRSPVQALFGHAWRHPAWFVDTQPKSAPELGRDYCLPEGCFPVLLSEFFLADISADGFTWAQW